MDPAQPSRIRPTASNRRKRTGLRAGVDPVIPEIHEDVDFHDDVAEHSMSLHIERGVSQDRRRMNESDSDEPGVRGINGGPLDMSLLKSFRTHVAFYISENKEREPLRCINHMKKIHTWSMDSGVANTRFLQLIQNSSLYPLVVCSYQYISSVELSAFVERWHPETNTFHLPFGEMTITLDDVACLLGLPVSGKSVIIPYNTDEDEQSAVELLTNSLGVGYSEAHAELSTKGGASVRLDWLRERFSDITDESPELRIKCAARAYLLFLLGCTLFGDKSGTRISVDYLALLHDVENVHTYAWGAGALAYLYRQLGLASRADSAQLSGYLTLLQAWIFAHISPLMPVLDDRYSPDQPLACRWLSRRDNNVTLDHVKAIRERLDTLTANEVTWDPYRPFRDIHPFQEVCFNMGTLKMKGFVEPYHPVRVLRQFGRRQYIPPSPFRPLRCKRGLNAKTYLVVHGHAEEMWLSWLDHVLAQEHRGAQASYPGECEQDYMRWYANVSRRFLGTSAEVPGREESQDIPHSTHEERNLAALSLIAPIVAEGEPTSTRRESLLYRAILKIQAALTGCTHVDTEDVVTPRSQTQSDGPSSSVRRQPSRRQPVRKHRRV